MPITIPSTGDIQFFSNANSTAVRQVLALATNNIVSLDGVKYRRANVNNSNQINEVTITRPISLRSFAGGFKGTIPAPSVIVFGIYSGQDIAVSYNPDSEDGVSEITYLGIGTFIGGTDVLTYSRRGEFNWVANPNPGSQYYVSGFTSNLVTGEKGLLYASGPITASNP
jgi:hypothetical protein